MGEYTPHLLWLNGKPIRWKRDEYDPTELVLWSRKTTGGKPIKGSLRTIAHLDRLNRLAVRRYGTQIQILQAPYNTTVPASAGTHDYDACVDWYIPGVGWWEQQRFGRANGHGCWYRHPPTFGNHIHGFTIPPQSGKVRADDFADGGFKVGKYVPGQLHDYYQHALGLAGQHQPGSDRSWFPANIRSTIFNLDAYIANRKRQTT